MAKIDYSKEVRLPDADSMNGGLSYPSAAFMIDLFHGPPRQRLTDDCAAPTNKHILRHLVYGYDVGPFNVSGLKPACESLKRIFTEVQKDKPDLYAQITTAGMLCCRAIRGTKNTPSNHSFGAAIDFKINKRLDDRGDGRCQRGLLEMYPYLHNSGFFWGAEYRGPYEDAMHFECSRELLLQWRKDGLI